MNALGSDCLLLQAQPHQVNLFCIFQGRGLFVSILHMRKGMHSILEQQFARNYNYIELISCVLGSPIRRRSPALCLHIFAECLRPIILNRVSEHGVLVLKATLLRMCLYVCIIQDYWSLLHMHRCLLLYKIMM